MEWPSGSSPCSSRTAPGRTGPWRRAASSGSACSARRSCRCTAPRAGRGSRRARTSPRGYDPTHRGTILDPGPSDDAAAGSDDRDGLATDHDVQPNRDRTLQLLAGAVTRDDRGGSAAGARIYVVVPTAPRGVAGGLVRHLADGGRGAVGARRLDVDLSEVYPRASRRRDLVFARDRHGANLVQG